MISEKPMDATHRHHINMQASASPTSPHFNDVPGTAAMTTFAFFRVYNLRSLIGANLLTLVIEVAICSLNMWQTAP